MGRRRRRVIRVVKRTLPKVFSCPRCGMVSIKVKVKNKGLATIACGSCGLSVEYTLSSKKEPIDVYNEFVDNYLSGKVSL
ncbi:MAG: hypothetical protein NZ896_05020 [Nitrososphaerales archaeon]|nr:hypothetical protein [Nitrososphaerales archaeon]